MKSLVRPELPTASACSSQATSAAVDNSAPVQTRPFSLIYRGLAVQTNRATSISGIMTGAFLSGRLAGKLSAAKQIRLGFCIMGASTAVNLVLNYTLKAQVSWALWPIALFAMGWAVMTPVVTLLVLDVVPTRRGMASSLQACITSSVNGLVAGVVAPWVMHSTMALALTSASMMGVGLLAWWWVRPRL